jgi:hypothetical protein
MHSCRRLSRTQHHPLPIPPISSLLFCSCCSLHAQSSALPLLHIFFTFPRYIPVSVALSLCASVYVVAIWFLFFFCMQTEIVFFSKPFFSFRSASLFSLASSSLSSSGLSLLLLFSLSPPVVSPVVSCSWCCVCLPCCVNPCTHLCEEVVRRRYWKSLIHVNPLVCKSGSFVFWCSLLSSVLSFLYFHAITNHLLRLSSIIFD